MRYEPFDPAAAARALGLSRLPYPLNPHDLRRSLPQHYPAELAGSGIRGAVLLSLDLDAQGTVVSAHAVEPPSVPGASIRAVLVDAATGAQRVVPPAGGAHPALQRAAETAVRVLRFAPAERDGHPAPFSDYRLTLELTPPDSEVL